MQQPEPPRKIPETPWPEATEDGAKSQVGTGNPRQPVADATARAAPSLPAFRAWPDRLPARDPFALPVAECGAPATRSASGPIGLQPNEYGHSRPIGLVAKPLWLRVIDGTWPLRSVTPRVRIIPRREDQLPRCRPCAVAARRDAAA